MKSRFIKSVNIVRIVLFTLMLSLSSAGGFTKNPLGIIKQGAENLKISKNIKGQRVHRVPETRNLTIIPPRLHPTKFEPVKLPQLRLPASGNAPYKISEILNSKPFIPESLVCEDFNILPRKKGFSATSAMAEVSPARTVRIDGEDCGTLDELFEKISDAVAQNKPLPIKEIRYEGMSPREVQAQIDNLRDCILKRTIGNETALNDFDINEIESIVKDNGIVVISLPQKESSILPDTFKPVKEDKVGKYDEILEQIKLELQIHPEIKPEDIKDEYIRLFGFIFIENGNVFKAEVAA